MQNPLICHCEHSEAISSRKIAMNCEIASSPLAPRNDMAGRFASSCQATAYSGIVQRLTYVTLYTKLTYMEKTQVYLRKEELAALRKAAARSGRSVADLVREEIRKVVLKPEASGPVGIWDGEPKRLSVDHDSVHDEP